MNLIDIHAHLNFPDYDKDREEVIKRTVEAGCGVINVGTDLKTSEEVVALTIHPNFWATVGVHPCLAGRQAHEAETMTEEKWRKLGELVKHERVVAIGECGLDYFGLQHPMLQETPSVKMQRAVFERQIILAIEVGKPLMLHIRNSYDDVLAILKNFPNARGNAHFFAGTIEQAKQFLNLGFTLSFTGVITFPPKTSDVGPPEADLTSDVSELIKFVPLDRLMAETDATIIRMLKNKNYLGLAAILVLLGLGWLAAGWPSVYRHLNTPAAVLTGDNFDTFCNLDGELVVENWDQCAEYMNELASQASTTSEQVELKRQIADLIEQISVAIAELESLKAAE
ncbi:MAG: TatD family hydrolase [Candidatus Vogelbacteria bacterium]|nr:TatD family hydrolase [Candidatus Vogelbacteria bacterium]